MVAFLILLALFGIFVTLLLVTIYQLARRRILWTSPQEGTAEAVTVNKTFCTIIPVRKGYHSNDPEKPWFNPAFREYEILRNEENDKYGSRDRRSWLNRRLGAYWVGFFRRVYEYTFGWIEVKTNGEFWVRKEPTHFIYIVDFTYAKKLTGAETQGNIPVDVGYIVTLCVSNPKIALFEVVDWLEKALTEVNRLLRDYVGGKQFEELRREADVAKSAGSHATPELSGDMIKLNTMLPDDSSLTTEKRRGLKGRYGVTLVSFAVVTVDLSNDTDGRFLKATTEQAVALQEGKAIVIRAEQDVRAATQEALARVARAEGRRQEANKMDAKAMEIRRLEAQEKAGVQGNAVIFTQAGTPAPSIIIPPKTGKGGTS